MHWSQQTPSSNNTRDDSTQGYQLVNTKIRLIIFFAAKDGEGLYSQLKQDWELAVAQIKTPSYQVQFSSVQSLNHVRFFATP